MRLTSERLERWLCWEAEWDMVRRRLPRPTLVGFDAGEASLIVYGPDGTVCTTPAVVRRLLDVALAVHPADVALTWPAVAGREALSARSRALRLQLVTVRTDAACGAVDLGEGGGEGPVGAARIAVVGCTWRGRTIAWDGGSEDVADRDPLVEKVAAVLSGGAESAPAPDRRHVTVEALSRDGYELFVDPGAALGDALDLDEVALGGGDGPWLAPAGAGPVAAADAEASPVSQ